MSVLTSLRTVLCCSVGLALPLAVFGTEATDVPKTFPLDPTITPRVNHTEETLPSPTTVSEVRPITVAVIMPSDNSPMLTAFKIVLNGLIAAGGQHSNLKLIAIETSNDLTTVEQQLQAAVIAGADVAVGPLQKDRVDELLELPYLPLPVVALNIGTHDGNPEKLSPLLFQMSLSTEQEAEYVAQQAIKLYQQKSANSDHIAILRDVSKADYKVTAGFEDVLSQNQIPYHTIPIDINTLNSSKRLFSDAQNAIVRHQLKLQLTQLNQELPNEQNLERQATLQRQLQQLPETNTSTLYPIVLVALSSPEAALAINRLPRETEQVFGISTLNPGDPETNATAKSLIYDLNNVQFVDSPLLVKYDADSFQARFNMPMPYSLTAKRLFALGHDALNAAFHWAHQEQRFSISGEAGEWDANRDANAQIKRTPATILIQDGELQILSVDKH